MRREAVATPIQVLSDRLEIRSLSIQFFPLLNVVTLKCSSSLGMSFQIRDFRLTMMLICNLRVSSSHGILNFKPAAKNAPPYVRLKIQKQFFRPSMHFTLPCSGIFL